MDKLDADNEDFIPDEANLKDPLEKIGKKNSNTINPPETIANLKSKSNNGYPDSSVNATVSLPFLVDEVDEDKPK